MARLEEMKRAIDGYKEAKQRPKSPLMQISKPQENTSSSYVEEGVTHCETMNNAEEPILVVVNQ
jgi:hypothetical protein